MSNLSNLVDIKITVKGESISLSREYPIYAPFTFTDNDPILQPLIQEVVAAFGKDEEIEKVIVKAIMERN